MSYKIYTEGNQTIVEKNNGQKLVALSKDVLVRPSNHISPEPSFIIEGIRGFDVWDIIELNDINKANGDPYTLEEFKAFYQNELGKGSAGSAAATTLRIKNQVLNMVDWILNTDTNLYEYTYLNETITLSTEPEMIPHNDSVDVVNTAAILPYTTLIEGGMIVYAENKPNEDITVNIIIKTVKDV